MSVRVYVHVCASLGGWMGTPCVCVSTSTASLLLRRLTQSKTAAYARPFSAFFLEMSVASPQGTVATNGVWFSVPYQPSGFVGLFSGEAPCDTAAREPMSLRCRTWP